MTTIFFEADVSRLYATIMDPLAPQAFPINVGPMASFLFFFFPSSVLVLFFGLVAFLYDDRDAQPMIKGAGPFSFLSFSCGGYYVYRMYFPHIKPAINLTTATGKKAGNHQIFPVSQRRKVNLGISPGSTKMVI